MRPHVARFLTEPHPTLTTLQSLSHVSTSQQLPISSCLAYKIETNCSGGLHRISLIVSFVAARQSAYCLSRSYMQGKVKLQGQIMVWLKFNRARRLGWSATPQHVLAPLSSSFPPLLHFLPCLGSQQTALKSRAFDQEAGALALHDGRGKLAIYLIYTVRLSLASPLSLIPGEDRMRPKAAPPYSRKL